MREESISFETAKLAVEKGLILKEYSGSGIILDKSKIGSQDDNDYAWICKQSLLQKILRDDYNIIVTVSFGCLSEKYCYEIQIKGKYELIDSEFIFKNYEDSLEEGLKEALKILPK